MRRSSFIRFLTLAATGATLLQAMGCSTTQLLEFTQTVFLGVTAAGAVAILQNL